MSRLDDASLVRSCIEGDRRAFEAILDRYERPVFNLVLRMLDDYEDARDLTQTVFVKAYQNLSSFDPDRRFFSWIYRIAMNESLNHLEKRAREGGGVELRSDDVRLSRSGEQRAAAASRDLYDALAQLKPEHRSVIVLKHIVGCSYHEMSAVLQIPEKTVKSRLFTAREQLRQTLLGHREPDER